MKNLFKSRYVKISFTILASFALCLIFWVFFNSIDLIEIISVILSILMPFFIGFAIAYLVNPVMGLFEKLLLKLSHNKPHKKLFRAISATLSILLSICVVVLLLLLIIPQLIESFYSLITSMPSYLTNLSYSLDAFFRDNSYIQYNINNLIDGIKNTISYYTDSIPAQLPNMLSILASSVFVFVDSIKNILLGIIISFYVLYNKEIFIKHFKKLLFSIFNFKSTKKIISVVSETHVVFGGFLTGVIIDSFIIGILCFIGVSILQMPYAVLIAVVIGVTNIIPFFGPFIGAIPCAFIILMDNPIKMIWFVIFIIALQQFDGNILKPKILGGTTGLATFWVLFAILLGGGLFGFLGMFLGVPVFSVIYTLFTRFINNRLKKKNLPIDSSAYLNSSNIKLKDKP